MTAAAALYNRYGINTNYCFNRKEEKDHGEGGSIVGYKLKDGDRVVITEDVITAGTAVRETLPVLKAAGDVTVAALIISVDRMERGQGEKPPCRRFTKITASKHIRLSLCVKS